MLRKRALVTSVLGAILLLVAVAPSASATYWQGHSPVVLLVTFTDTKGTYSFGCTGSSGSPCTTPSCTPGVNCNALECPNYLLKGTWGSKDICVPLPFSSNFEFSLYKTGMCTQPSDPTDPCVYYYVWTGSEWLPTIYIPNPTAQTGTWSLTLTPSDPGLPDPTFYICSGPGVTFTNAPCSGYPEWSGTVTCTGGTCVIATISGSICGGAGTKVATCSFGVNGNGDPYIISFSTPEFPAGLAVMVSVLFVGLLILRRSRESRTP